MAEMRVMNVPYKSDLCCPVCGETLEINVEVELKAESAQTAGRDGFGKTTLMQVHIERRPIKVTIRHECLYTEE